LPKIEQERQAVNCNQLRSGFESYVSQLVIIDPQCHLRL